MKIVVSTIVMGMALLVVPAASADVPGSDGTVTATVNAPCIGCW